jgi:eukaryotic-like serine/threonine-protein kinase
MAFVQNFRPSVEPGDILAGKYQVERVLGEGGMGLVVAAKHLQLEARVAIKLLLPEMLDSADAVARFLREARAAARITNDHVVRVTDVGTLESGAPYMVMEYLEGSDLAAVLRSSGPMASDQAVALVLETCEALAEAHASGVVHRDLKPANLFWAQRTDGSRCLKVLDFGISKVVDAPANAASTKTSALLGTPYYMSPEQMTSSRDVDARTDIWALGVILYQLLANDLPFDGDTLPAVCVSVATAPPISLRSRRLDLPAGLEAVILRCLEKDPNRRFASVKELAFALASYAPARAPIWAERTGGVARAPRESRPASQADLASHQPTQIAVPSPVTVSPFHRTHHQASARPSRTVALVVLLSLATLGTAAVAFWLLRSNSSPPLPVAAAPALLASVTQATSPPSVATPVAPPPIARPNVAPVPQEVPLVAAGTDAAKPEPASPSEVTPPPLGRAPARPAPKSKRAPHPVASAERTAGAAPVVRVPATASTQLPAHPPVEAPNPAGAFDDRE